MLDRPGYAVPRSKLLKRLPMQTNTVIDALQMQIQILFEFQITDTSKAGKIIKKEQRKIIRFLSYVILIFLMFYILSIGPAYAIVTNSILESAHPNTLIHPGVTSFFGEFESFEFFYSPLLWIGDKNLIIYELLADYMEFCHSLLL
ncbi:hypothetical protein V6x_52140 [Gimesia chilikensis]|uniref:Uncharacterized protein n=2 Tax=Gimesia TaxID=1649453 RepID=A0A6I6AE36_9PLAN|nr:MULTISPECIES: hypothetical protein [Gimesia]QDU05477.1 hypothetical protein V6x_52140 [Gimesia chilikensis]QGQ24693.1 hypothetical protein F1728_19250 [Gimesia benthica]